MSTDDRFHLSMLCDLADYSDTVTDTDAYAYIYGNGWT